MADEPNPHSLCGGAYGDWLEVMLTPDCNGHCSWCIERGGWHPTERASWKTIADAALGTGKPNIILLGGEPTLYPEIGKVIERLRRAGRKVWITTNGSRLTPSWVAHNLVGISGVNISIHDDSLPKNRSVTGIRISAASLHMSIRALHSMGASVRFNCNCIKGHVDSRRRIHEYIRFASDFGADKVRFAELKGEEGDFVDLAVIMDHEYGLNDDPYHEGCSHDCVIDGMPVNFRQMCGLQSTRRPRPENPRDTHHQVLYYDGKLYDGWQRVQEDRSMDSEQLVRLLTAVRSGQVSVLKAAAQLEDRDGVKDEAGGTGTFPPYAFPTRQDQPASGSQPPATAESYEPTGNGGCAGCCY